MPSAVDNRLQQLRAALHDIGKTMHPEELTQPCHAHEVTGESLLHEHGLPAPLARFARTHRQWADELTPQPEDWLVALADTWWRGKREEHLEAGVCRWIAEQTQTAQWQVFTARADARLAWQRQFAT